MVAADLVMMYRFGIWGFGLALTLGGCTASEDDAMGDTEGGTEGTPTTGDEPTTGAEVSSMTSANTDSDDGSSGDPTDPTDPTDDPTDPTDDPTDPTDDPTAGEVCGETPTRMMFFGDSLFACFGQDGGTDGMGCSARLAHEYLEQTYAPGATYENLAVSGAVTSEVVREQMPNAPVGMPGHTLVVIWVGGNDISPLLLASDEEAQDSYDNELGPSIRADWESMLAWVDDPANFPDGATLIINTQFNPFDDCSADPFAFMSPLKTMLLGDYNDELRAYADGNDRRFVADQYPVFLGHGHHWNSDECPHYESTNDYWMIGGTDLVHPNTLGHVSMAGTLRGTLDEIYRCE